MTKLTRQCRQLLLFIAIMGLVFASSVHSASLSVSWEAPTTNDDGTPLIDLDHYNLYRCQGSGCVPTYNREVGQVTSLTDTGLDAATIYRYQLTAVNTSGNQSALSLLAEATTGTDPPPPTDGLIAAYGFNESAGSALNSSTGQHHGTISGAKWTTGKYGKALSFDGINDLVNIPDAPALRLTTTMTLMAWIYPTSSSGTRDVLIKEGTGGDIYNLYARNWRGRPEMNALVNGQINQTAEGLTLQIYRWIHLAGTYDGSVLRLYKDGAQVATRAVSGSVPATTEPLRIGGNAIWGEYFKGRIDEVRIYDRALSQSEIQADRSTPLP